MRGGRADVMAVVRTVGGGSRGLQIARSWDVEERAELAKFEVDESAFSVARRFCDGGRRNARALLVPKQASFFYRSAVFPEKSSKTSSVFGIM